jgi:hypothetical protein
LNLNMKKRVLISFLLVGLLSLLPFADAWAQCTPDRTACELDPEFPICISPQEIPSGRVGQPFNQTIQILVGRQITNPQGGQTINLTRLDIIEAINLPAGLSLSFQSGNPSDRRQDSILAVWTVPRNLPAGEKVGIFGCMTISGTPTEPTNPKDTTQLRIRVYASIGPLTIPVLESPFPFPIVIEGDQEPLTVDAGPDVRICAGQSVQLNASPCTRGFTYRWSPSTGLSNPNSCNPTANPTQTTTYTVTMSDGSNTGQDVVTVNVLPTPTVTATVRNISCTTQGNIRLAFTGGTAPYNITQNGVTIAENVRAAAYDFSVERAGIYRLTVTDANGCVLSLDPINVRETPNTLRIRSISVPASVGTGTGLMRIRLSGGTPPYEYSIDGGATFVASDSISVFNVRAGNLDLLVRDSTGCRVRRSNLIIK